MTQTTGGRVCLSGSTRRSSCQERTIIAFDERERIEIDGIEHLLGQDGCELPGSVLRKAKRTLEDRIVLTRAGQHRISASR